MDESIDVCVIYEHHGESEGDNIKKWLQKQISSMPSAEFLVVVIHSGNVSDEDLKLNIENMANYQTLHIDIRKAWEPSRYRQSIRRSPSLPAAAELLHALHSGRSSEICDAMEELQHQLENSPNGARAAFLQSEFSWKMLRDSYSLNASGESFQDFFDLSRALLAPLFAFAELLEALPKARCYHALTHGYAGYLGTLLKKRYNTKLISSNQGSQTPELQNFILVNSGTTEALKSFEQKKIWLRLRGAMQHLTYNRATAITTSSQFQYDRYRQELGPSPAIHLISEGIDTDYYLHLFTQHPAGPPPVVATIGPVDPTRDTKGFIRAIANLRDRLPHITAWVVGSLHSDPHYVKECKSLVRNLGLYNHLRFFGEQDESTIYPRIGALVINTLSDTPPITLQQAQAAGVPVIATDVGASKEFIVGRDQQDQELGLSGAVVPIADPAETSKAIAALLGNHEVWKKSRLAGVKRCQRYYGLNVMLQQYQSLYKNTLPAGS